MILMQELSQFIFSYTQSSGFDLNTVKIAIYPGSELDNIFNHGTSKINININNLNSNGEYLDIITAFTINDILEDAKLEKNGIMYHKLSTYNNPFLTFYDGIKLKEVLIEKETNSINKNYLFIEENKADAVLGLASININNMMTGALTNLSQSIGSLNTERFPRFYLTMTNFCNRSCPFCCCSSGPDRKTFLSFDRFLELLSMENDYEVQFEGGEPLLHPDFWKMVNHCVNDDKCKLIVLCTNSVLIPFKDKDKLNAWLNKFINKPFILKPSYNSYLVSKDKKLINKLKILKEVWYSINWKIGSNLVINARRDQTKLDKEIWITEELKKADLISNSNIFFYQKMGMAKDEQYIEPVIIQNNVKFYLIAPDGTNWATGLTERAKYMENMK